MIRKLSALGMIACLSACASQSKRAGSPEMAPASPTSTESAPSSGAMPSSAPAVSPPSGAAAEEPAPPPPTTTTPTDAPSTKSGAAGPSTAPKAPSSAPAGGDSGGGGKKPNAIGVAQSSFDDARKTFIAAADCVHMCKALGSMSNATTHLCELTQGGGEQKRCTDAKAKLAAADAKVKSTCGGCSD